MKRLVTGCVLALGLVLAGAGAANAGEATGNGGEAQGASHASSECAFSGQDTVDSVEGNPEGFDDDALAMRGNQKHGYHGIQSYGMFVSAGIDVGVNPGLACRGNAGH
ncbi:hypothetical protein HF576_11130 [Microbacterium sp. CFH 90308]|uniref:Secreted protein n=1 Tax=Microbacterium salsuginis TaxID=2722803 RepID=A0ABX1KBK1_9MICO|nr:hypothetical protein [Microbacterium sp. CFH 90308]NLP84406.1 hypothetical protein [Microbacterium sp. CFH 90308]